MISEVTAWYPIDIYVDVSKPLRKFISINMAGKRRV